MKSFAAGTTNAKEVVLPENFWRFFNDTVLLLRICSRRLENFRRLSSGRINACFSESQIEPKNRTADLGIMELFLNPMKYPRLIRTEQAMKAAISAK